MTRAELLAEMKTRVTKGTGDAETMSKRTDPEAVKEAMTKEDVRRSFYEHRVLPEEADAVHGALQHLSGQLRDCHGDGCAALAELTWLDSVAPIRTPQELRVAMQRAMNVSADLDSRPDVTTPVKKSGRAVVRVLVAVSRALREEQAPVELR